MKRLQYIFTYFVFIIGMMFWGLMPSILHSQTVVAIGDYADCSQTEVLVPINIENFNDVAAITLHIKIDTTQLEFVGVENVNDVFISGDFIGSVNLQNQIITLTWLSFTPANLENGVMCDMRVILKSEISELVFNDNCELANSSLAVISDVTYTNGSLIDLLSFEIDPLSQIISQGGNANLSMISLPDNVACQWQVMEDDIWVEVQDDVYYQGAHTSLLSIFSVSEEMNNTSYRCMMTTDNCHGLSQTSELLVVPNGLGEDDAVDFISAYPNPVHDNLYCFFGKSFIDLEVKVVNDVGSIVLSKFLDDVVTNSEIRLDLSELPEGIYLFQVFSNAKLLEVMKVIRN